MNTVPMETRRQCPISWSYRWIGAGKQTLKEVLLLTCQASSQVWKFLSFAEASLILFQGRCNISPQKGSPREHGDNCTSVPLVHQAVLLGLLTGGLLLRIRANSKAATSPKSTPPKLVPTLKTATWSSAQLADSSTVGLSNVVLLGRVSSSRAFLQCWEGSLKNLQGFSQTCVFLFNSWGSRALSHFLKETDITTSLFSASYL